MPGPYIHIAAMRHVGRDLARDNYLPIRSGRIDPAWTGADTRDLGQLLTDHPNFASLGAVGPDLFFFLPDFRDEHGIVVSSVLITVLDFIEEVYDAIDPYISKWEHYLGPISEDTAEELSRLTGGLSESVGNIAGELSGILITALEDFVTQQADFWEFFSLGLNRGWDEQAYFWSDMLHYRDTGHFARSLWREAQQKGDDGAQAYALGYMTHLATDVTGHAFVNAISGGPFRLHWQRHHLVENHMDAEWYLQDPLSPRSTTQYPQLTESALYYDIAFGDDGGVRPKPSYPTGNTLRDNWERRRKLDIDSDLPDVVADILLSAMIDVFYQGEPHPKILRDNDGRPSTDLIKEAYRLLFRYLKFSTVDGFSHEIPDPPDIFPNLDFPTPTDPNEDPPGDDDGDFWDDLLDFILSVVNLLSYLVEVAVYIATLPWAILADVLTYHLRLALYYAYELPLFHMLKAFRSVLVMTGYLLPMEDEIAFGLTHIGATDRDVFRNVLDQLGDVFGGITPVVGEPGLEQTFRDRYYPRRHPDEEFRHPWAYPTEDSELGLTTAGPYAERAGVGVLFGDLPSDPSIRDRLESAETPTHADRVGPDLTPRQHLGDAVSFSKYLLWLESRDPEQADGYQVPVVEWNLDADRGYGYQCWDWNRDANLPAEQDPEGNNFQPPCTWPPQDEHKRWHSDVPLQLHWVGRGRQDPGCAHDGPFVTRRPDGIGAGRQRGLRRRRR